MEVKLLRECGYEEAALGFALSYNITVERAKEIMPKFAFGKPGENKFLESMILWVEVKAPRFFHQENDTYRLETKQSESTMHTIMKGELTPENFQYEIYPPLLSYLNETIRYYQSLRVMPETKALRKHLFKIIKNNLPEGFLQKRIECFSYKTLRNKYEQRKDHRLEEWQVYLLDTLMKSIEHPEFIDPNSHYVRKEE